MQNNSKQPNYIHDISPEKMNLINSIINQSKAIPKEQKISFFLAAAANAQSKGITFTPQETDIILNSLKANMTPAQKSQLDSIRNIAQMLQKKHS